MKRWFPWILVAGVAIWLLGTLRPPKPDVGFQLQEFGKLPVLLNGRTQPMDSVARNSLLILRGKQTVPVDKGPALTAMQWFLELSYKPTDSDNRAVFRIDHPELRGLLDLNAEEKFFSFTST